MDICKEITDLKREVELLKLEFAKVENVRNNLHAVIETMDDEPFSPIMQELQNCTAALYQVTHKKANRTDV